MKINYPGDLKVIEAEFKIWKAFWSVEGSNPQKDVISSLKICDSLQTFSNIKVLFQIYATLPVTTASSERSFSCLKYLKNYLRSTMGEARLNGVAQMFINRDIKLNCEKVLKEFKIKKTSA